MTPLPSARAALTVLLALAALGAPPQAEGACSGPEGGAARAIPDAAGPIGVVGVVTAFGSLCVNGLQIHYEDDTPVTVNGRPANPPQLAPGQVVAVEARSAGGRLAAQSIAIVRVLEGPVTRVDAGARTLFVMDQPVRVTDETMSPVREQLLELKPGATVEVSGYRNARGEVVASRIDLAPPRGGHSAIGRMKVNPRETRTAEMGDLVVALAGDTRVQKESDVLVRGLWDGGALRAGTVSQDPSMQLLGRVDRAVVESLVHEPRRGDRMRVGRVQVRIARGARVDASPAALRIDRQVRVTGVPDRRHGMVAERIEVPPPGQLRALAEQRAELGDARVESAVSPEPARPERMGRDNPRLSRVERVERIERDTAAPERAERVERREPTRVERPEPTRVERPEISRVVERLFERPERAERPDRSGRDRD